MEGAERKEKKRGREIWISVGISQKKKKEELQSVCRMVGVYGVLIK